MQFIKRFQRRMLLLKPDIFEIDGWKIESLAFCQAGNEGQLPVFMLSGAFQTFRDFCGEVEELLVSHPVYLVDLPGQGSNEQIAAGLSLADLADLLAAWAKAKNIERLHLYAHSFGATIACKFVLRHDHMLERLILFGAVESYNIAHQLVIKMALAYLEEGKIEEFAYTALNHLGNPAIFGSLGLSLDTKKALQNSLLSISKNKIARFRDNSLRVLTMAVEKKSKSQVKSLIFCGELDSFSRPADGWRLACRISGASFGILPDVDHLAQHGQHPKKIASVIARFINGLDCQDLFSGKLWADPLKATFERRLDERKAVEIITSLLLFDQQIPVLISEISTSGFSAMLRQDIDIAQLCSGSRFQIELPGFRKPVTSCVVHRTGKKLHCFMLKDFDGFLDDLNLLLHNADAENSSDQMVSAS